MKPIELGHVYGLRITAKPSAIISFVVLWLVLSLGAILFLQRIPPLVSVLGALVAAVLHYFSELFHHLGHARAARSVGYPMIGVRFWYLLAQSIYPKDEPPLPANTHIRRALGGPLASLLLAILSGILILVLAGSMMFEPPEPPALTAAWYVLFFLFLDNLLVFTLGAFLPLGFTDGSTILYWWGKRSIDN
jgi:hypothetical protein